MSLNASGTLGNIIQFQQRKGGGCLKKNATPFNPRSSKQTAIRTCMKFLSQQWAGIYPEDKATWAERASLLNISPYNTYIAHNMERFRNGLGLQRSTYYDMANPGTIDEFNTTDGLIRRFLWDTYSSDPGISWGCFLYARVFPDDSYTWDAVVEVAAMNGSDVATHATELAAGTYNVAVQCFSVNGKLRETSKREATIEVYDQ